MRAVALPRTGIALAHLQCMLLAGLLLAGADALAAGGGRPAALISAAGLCLLGAVLVALPWATGLALSAHRSRALVAVAWSVPALAFAHGLNQGLGVYPRLWGAHQTLALLALGGSTLATAGLLSLALALRPNQLHPRGWLAGRTPIQRALLSAALGSASAACVVADRTIEVGGYETGHLALRLVALVTASNALFIGSPRLRQPPRWRARAVLGTALLWALVPLGTLAEDRSLRHEMRALVHAATVLDLVRALSDVDGDGYSHLLGGGDCAALDGAIHPGARDVPGNGVDENCRLGDARPRMERAITAPAAHGDSPISVVLITVDSLAPSRLGSYGGDPAVAPHIDHWAKRALRFEHAFTSGGWTTLALSSMFRGLYARKLRWSPVLETNLYRMLRPSALPGALRPKERIRLRFTLPLSDPRMTLPQWLRRRGMRTIAVVDDGYTEVLSGALGGFPGFDRYHQMQARRSHWPNDRKVTDQAKRSLARAGNDPFFMWVHYFGPHLPSSNHRDLPDFGGGEAGEYDREIRFLDKQLRPLLGALRRKSKQVPLVVILTSDHGEALRPGWRGHGRDLREDSLRIPLFIRGHGIEPGVSPVPASLVDIMPTILALTETPGPEDMDGQDLLKLAHLPRRRVLFSDTFRLHLDGRMRIDQAAAFDGHTKLTADLVRMDSWLSRQSAERERYLRGAPRPRWLEQPLMRYLEQHGQLWVVPDDADGASGADAHLP